MISLKCMYCNFYYYKRGSFLKKRKISLSHYAFAQQMR